MKKISNEIITGIIVILSVALLVFFMYKTGKVGVKRETYELTAIFSTASGIENHAPVMLAGVEVGEVSDIKLSYGNETKVILSLLVDESAKVREDSQASINTLGLMGEKYVEISAGSLGVPFISPGATIIGEEPFQFEKLAKRGEEIAETLDATLIDIRGLVNSLDGVVTNNEEGVGRIITDLEATAKNFKEFSEDIKRHPWKLIIKGKEKKPRKERKERRKRSR